jgi:hypothetical protein
MTRPVLRLIADDLTSVLASAACSTTTRAR